MRFLTFYHFLLAMPNIFEIYLSNLLYDLRLFCAACAQTMALSLIVSESLFCYAGSFLQHVKKYENIFVYAL